ncbi:MAG TPA: DNA mismatch repair protein MutS [Candidatus Xenobia bacterium]|jgi:hypothetical protein
MPALGVPSTSSAISAEVYRQRLGERQATLEEWLRRDRAMATARMWAFFAILVVLYFGTYGALFSPAWTVLPVLAFGMLMVRHQRILEGVERARRAVSFYQAGLGRLEDTWAGQGVAGETWLDPAHPYAADLDIFGPGSMFELLCTARTEPGQARLAAWLRAPAAPAAIRERQSAVADLKDRLDLREDLAVLTAKAGVLPVERMLEWAKAPRRLHGWGLRILALGLAVATLWGFGYWMATGDPRPLGVLLVVEQAVLSGLAPGVGVVAQDLVPLADLETLFGYLARLEREKFTSPLMERLAGPLAMRPSAAVAKAQRLAQWLDSPRNPFFAPIAYMMMWRLQFAYEMEAWRGQWGAEVAGWLEVVAETEALLSLASRGWERPDEVVPEVVDEGCCLEGEGLGHPLLPAATCIRNDVTFGEERRLYVVSGSNMSGKSSFLRTIGVNTVLALAGGTVRATRLKLSPLAVGASLRVADSLQQGISHFYAEIRRLRQITEMAGQSPTLLFLLDEMLQGTNSYDRGIGATAVLQALVERGAIGLVTTHDLNLTSIVETLRRKAVNVHFEDHLEDGQMKFDYTLRAGVVEKSNAVALMRAVGLPV